MAPADITHKRSDFYVYVIFRPDGTPCYLGKGKGRRWKFHFTRSNNIHLARIIREAGGRLPAVKIRENLIEDDAFATEIALIAAIGRECAGEGPLVNLTTGGDGVSGRVYSCLERQRLSDQALARWSVPGFKETQLAAMKAGLSPESFRAISTAAKARVYSDKTRAKMGVITKARWEDSAYRERQSVSLKLFYADPEMRARMGAISSTSQKGKKLTLEHCAKISARRTGAKATQETRDKMSVSRKGKKQAPEHAAKHGVTRRINPDRVLTQAERNSRYRARKKAKKAATD